MIKLPGYFLGYGSKSDNSLGLRFATQEVPLDVLQALHSDLNAFGWVMFVPEGETLPDVPKEKITDGRKSQATRLRAVLYKLHEQNGGKKEDAEKHYMVETEKVIEHYKLKLD